MKARPIERKDEEEEYEVAASIAAKQTNHRNSKFKSKEFVEDSECDNPAPAKLSKVKLKSSVKTSSSSVVVHKSMAKSKPGVESDSTDIDPMQETGVYSNATGKSVVEEGSSAPRLNKIKANPIHVAEDSDVDHASPPRKKSRAK